MIEKKVKMIVKHKKGETIVTTDSGQEWKFSKAITDETIIASLVFQTVFSQYTARIGCGLDFTLEFSMGVITLIP